MKLRFRTAEHEPTPEARRAAAESQPLVTVTGYYFGESKMGGLRMWDAFHEDLQGERRRHLETSADHRPEIRGAV